MEKYALTGTPGTGKTSVSNLLSVKVKSLSKYYEEASEGKTKNGEWLVDIEKLNKILETSDSRIFEGNFAHKLKNINKIIIYQHKYRSNRLFNYWSSHEKKYFNRKLPCFPNWL